MTSTPIQQRFAASTPPGRSVPPAAGQGFPLTLARVSVLVIEDEAMIAWMLESLLEDMGFEAIALASNAIEAAAAVVFVSGYIDENARSRISEQVADARILSKPVSGDGLFSIIRDALGLNRAN